MLVTEFWARLVHQYGIYELIDLLNSFYQWTHSFEPQFSVTMFASGRGEGVEIKNAGRRGPGGASAGPRTVCARAARAHEQWKDLKRTLFFGRLLFAPGRLGRVNSGWN